MMNLNMGDDADGAGKAGAPRADNAGMIEMRLMMLSWFTTQLVILACIEGLAVFRTAFAETN